MKGNLAITYGALANPIRDQLVEHHQNQSDRDIAGTSTPVYDRDNQQARKFGK